VSGTDSLHDRSGDAGIVYAEVDRSSVWSGGTQAQKGRSDVEHARSGDPWAAEEESAMVNSFDDGSSIAAIGELLHRPPMVVRERLRLFGRLPACDPVRAEEDRQLAAIAEQTSAVEQAAHELPAQIQVVAPRAGAGTRRGPVGRLLDKFLRT
jgi:hypothetical protein